MKIQTLTEWMREIRQNEEPNCSCCIVIGTKVACSDCKEVLAKQRKFADADVLKQKLQEMLDDFGDLSDYDNDDVIELYKALKGLLAELEGDTKK